MDYILAILSFIEIKLKFGTWRQNRDFFGTFFALWSHLGPSPKFGTLSERLYNIVITSKTLRRALLGERGRVEEARLLSTTSSTGQLPSLPKAAFLPQELIVTPL